MVHVAEAALKERARTLLVAMTERARWVYALPRTKDGDRTWAMVEAAFSAHGVPQRAEEAEAPVSRYASEDGSVAYVVFEHDDLDVLFVEAEGEGAVPLMLELLERTGFVPQSALWGDALDIGGPRSSWALSVLAHMAVAWDDDWTDLFLLHLASPDALVRRQAALALTLAAMVARDSGPALELLAEALRREKFPQLRVVLEDAERVLSALAGNPVDLGEAGTSMPNAGRGGESHE
ncbi:MAG: hypothetical protein R3B72_26955 [Polyangiaceae bacterium]